MQFFSAIATALFVAGAIAGPIQKRDDVVVVHKTVLVTETAAPVTVNVEAKEAVVVTKTAPMVWVTVTKGAGYHGYRKPRPSPVVVSQPPVVVETPKSTPVETPVSTPVIVVETVKSTPVETPVETPAVAETTEAAPTTSSVAAAVVSAASSSDYGLDTAKILELHNSFRAKHGAEALTWDDTIANSALEHASGCIFEHTGLGAYANVDRQYGQNLWVTTVTPKGDVDLASAFADWADNEMQYYTGGFSEKSGHLTQIVWKSTTKLGCALYQCDGPISGRVSYESGSLLTCEYDPAGNVEGQYETEVSL